MTERINGSSNKRNMVLSFIALAALLVLVYVLDIVIKPTSSWNNLMTCLEKGTIYALVAVSMNLLNGFTGLFSLGQAGFMLIGAYAYAVFAIAPEDRATVYQYYEGGGLIHFSLPHMLQNMMGGADAFGGAIGYYLGIILLMIFAGLLTAGIAFLIGIPVLRLKSDYLAIATLGFAEIIRSFFQWEGLGPVTNGSNVLRKFASYDSSIFPVLVAGVCIAFIVMLINSSYGRAFKSIRDDEIAAEAMGVNLFKHKELSFVISSFFAGVGGALLAMFQNNINASPFTSNMTYEILLIVVIGGIGSVTGSIIGSYLFIACSEWWLRGLDKGEFLGIEADFMTPGFRKVVFAVVIMGIVLFYSRGIMGTKEFSWDGLFNFFRTLPARIAGIPGKIKAKFSAKKHKKNTKKVKEAQ